MSEDPFANYQEKAKQLDEAAEAINKIIQIITTVAEDLKQWEQVDIIGVIGQPRHLIASKRTINFNNWPTGEVIINLFSHWYKIKFETHQAYEEIPESRRTKIEPPRE